MRSVPFLGHVISCEGVEVDPKKMHAFRNFPRPLTPTNIIYFLDLIGYYRSFVNGFSSITSPFTTLTKNKVNFECLDACEKSFQELKDKLVSSPVLTLMELMKAF